MRVLVAWLLALGLAVLPAMAATRKAGDGTDSTTSAAKANADATAAKAKKDEASKTDILVKPEPSSLEHELQQLRDLLVSQSKELEATREQLQQQQKKMEALENQLRAGSDARAASTVAAAPSGSVQPAISAAGPVISGQPMTATQGYGNDQGEKKSPLSFKIGVADFTPGGFLDFTSIFRSTNVGSGIGTSFGGIPFNNTLPQAALTESRFTAQNSRLSLKVDANASESTHVTGYVEADFLGFLPPNGNQTSNSDSLRLRLYWADVRHGNWEVLGGQDWTFMTPNRVGLSPMPSDIFYTQNMDTNYQVGLIWARQAQFRVVYHPTKWWAFGVSLENPQQFAPSSVVFPSSATVPSTFFSGQFENGSGSTSAASAATNPAVPNLHPDVVVKTAFDGHVGGRAMHVEAAGLVRSFKVLNGLATPATTSTLTGGGGSFNVNLEMFKNFHLIGNSFYSYGGGRYIFGLGPDLIVRPDGHLSGVHSGSGIGGFEWQTNPHFMVYGYYGGAYFQRNFGFLPSSAKPAPKCDGVSGFTCVGFGFPGSSTSSNRAIQEGTIGFIPTIWSSPNYGKLQIITQYSYLVRSPWDAGTVGKAPAPVVPGPKNAHTSLIYVDLRYVLP